MCIYIYNVLVGEAKHLNVMEYVKDVEWSMKIN